MATSRNNISSKFNTGMIPTEGDFDEIFESFIHKDDKADFQMVETGTDDEHYVTPALLRTGLQNLGIITGNCYMPYKEHKDDFSGTELPLINFPIENSVKVFKNGQLLLEGENGDYTINYNTAVISFSDPVSNRNIEVDYWFKNLGPVPGNTDITDLGSTPFEKLDEGNGSGIVIRGRDSNNYGTIGLNAVDLSFSDENDLPYGATGLIAYAEGYDNIASGDYTHVEGNNNIASGTSSHSEGDNNISSGQASHAEGAHTHAIGAYSHSEGNATQSIGDYSHTEGYGGVARGRASHIEGFKNQANGDYSHAGGCVSKSNGVNSFVHGEGLTAFSLSEIALGMFNTDYIPASETSFQSTDRIFGVGNGTSLGFRSDAFTILKNGLATLPSVTNDLILAASGKAIVTKEYVQSAAIQGIQNVLDTNPTIDEGAIVLQENGLFSLISGNSNHASGRFHIGTLNSPSPTSELAFIGIQPAMISQDLALKFTLSKAVFVDDINNKGLEYAGNYESNFIPRSLVTKQYVDSVTNSYLNKGTILIGDVNTYSVNHAYSTTGNINSAIITTRTDKGDIITVTLNNSYPNLNYEVIVNIESLGDMESDNDLHPVIWKKISTNSFFIYLEETGNITQNIKLHIKTLAL